MQHLNIAIFVLFFGITKNCHMIHYEATIFSTAFGGQRIAGFAASASCLYYSYRVVQTMPSDMGTSREL
jgi:hypothetical protein